MKNYRKPGFAGQRPTRMVGFPKMTGKTVSQSSTDQKVSDSKNLSSKKYLCCICGTTSFGWGNNPSPVKTEGRCCDSCNSEIVIPTRFLYMISGKGW